MPYNIGLMNQTIVDQLMENSEQSFIYSGNRYDCKPNIDLINQVIADKLIDKLIQNGRQIKTQ